MLSDDELEEVDDDESESESLESEDEESDEEEPLELDELEDDDELEDFFDSFSFFLAFLLGITPLTFLPLLSSFIFLLSSWVRDMRLTYFWGLSHSYVQWPLSKHRWQVAFTLDRSAWRLFNTDIHREDILLGVAQLLASQMNRYSLSDSPI